MADDIVLRDVTDDDLPIFFEQQLDPDAIYMAAFTSRDPTDRDAFMAHRARISADETTINRTVLCDGQVAGSVASFEDFGQLEVTYWLGRAFWGQGIATRALTAFLAYQTTRPIYARAAKDNAASLRVLQKCGFVITGEDKGYANARGQVIEEYILTLAAETPASESE
ncbi:MAG TPA: GNAT family N-acetyltransferase [Ktedonobacterales bacterium]|nr:GNAT family N-acetyltransferase [Ktedonobacterales bacterium]